MQSDPVQQVTRLLEDFLVEKYGHALQSWPADIVADTYALSQFRNDTSVPYRPALFLASNTRSNLARKHAATLEEARWNLAYWLPPPSWVGIEIKRSPHGSTITDARGAHVLDEWLSTVTGGRSTADAAEAIIPLFSQLACRVGRRLHDSGLIRQVFGWAVPIIMHDDEWDDAILLNTQAANPPGVADEFLSAKVF